MELHRLQDIFDRLFQIPLKMIKYDANESNRTRYKESIDDAFTRATSAVLGMKYEDALDEQLRIAGFLRCNSNNMAVLDFMMEKHGYQIFKLEKPYTVLSFLLSNLNGRWLICTEKTTIAIISATVVDICLPNETVPEHLENVLGQLVTRVYELLPKDKRQVFEGMPGEKKPEETSKEVEAAPEKPKKKSHKKTKSSKESA